MTNPMTDAELIADARYIVLDGDKYGTAARHSTNIHTRQTIEKLADRLEALTTPRAESVNEELVALKELLARTYGPIASIKRFDPNGDERYPVLYRELLLEIADVATPAPHHAIVALTRAQSVPAMPMQLFHDAWAYAKEHPEEHARGYDKPAFGYVQHWLDKVAQSVPATLGDCTLLNAALPAAHPPTEAAARAALDDAQKGDR